MLDLLHIGTMQENSVHLSMLCFLFMASLIIKANFHIASVPKIQNRYPSLKHTLRILNNSLDNGGDGFHKRVLCVDFHFPVTYLSFRGWQH